MREMKDSGIEWVGTIPAHWSTMPNKYVMRKIKVINPTYNGENILSLTVNGVIVRDLEAGGKMPSSFDGYQILYKGNLLMCLFDYDVTPRCIGLIKDSGVSSPAYSQFVLQRGNDAAYFYYYYLMVDHTKALLHRAKNLRHSFTEEQLGAIKVPVPPIAEQERIADFLDSQCSQIDAISADIQKEIEILEQCKRSVITEAVTKGLNPDVEMKDSGIEWVGNVPDHWGVLANKYVMKKRKDICTKWNGENVLSLTMNGVIVRDLDNPVGKMPTTFDGYQFVYSGNLLMCLFDYDVTPRCVGIVKNAGVTSPAYSRFELKENATLEYFYYYYLMIDFTKELLHLAKNLRHSFTEEQLGALKVPLPPLDEQKNIATYLDSKCKEIESVIASKKQQLEVLDSYKKSLIYEYVTGKKEVPMYES